MQAQTQKLLTIGLGASTFILGVYSWALRDTVECLTQHIQHLMLDLKSK